MGRWRQETLFDVLPKRGLEIGIRAANPWWEGERIVDLPPMRRWPFDALVRGLKKGLTPALVLTGPRQIGKTTLLNHVISQFLDEGFEARSIFRVQFDDLAEVRRVSMPIIELCEWYSEAILGMSFAKAARKGAKPLIFLDEVQNLKEWAPQLKQLVDLNPVRVLVTGSSALRIEAGRDSLAGRITTIEMGPLTLREIARIRGFGEIKAHLPHNGLAPLKEKEFWRGLRTHGEQNRVLRDQAFSAFSARGAYPVSQSRTDEPWERVADFLNESVIRKAIKHDLRMGPRGQRRDEKLLEEVFRLACRYIGQTPRPDLYLEELHQAMGANIGQQRVLAYLKFLDGTLLVRLVEPLELRLKKKRGPAKLCLCDHTLRAAWLQESIPLTPMELEHAPHLGDLAGRVAESTTGYFLRSIIGLDVAYFPERGAEPEVDFVLTIGEQRIPIEVKYRRRIDYKDTIGLRSFIEKSHYNAPFGVLVTLNDDAVSDDPRIVSMPLSTLLLLR
ncbi:MAG: ATP-binding protein [Planctomycetota bacterium]